MLCNFSMWFYHVVMCTLAFLHPKYCMLGTQVPLVYRKPNTAHTCGKVVLGAYQSITSSKLFSFMCQEHTSSICNQGNYNLQIQAHFSGWLLFMLNRIETAYCITLCVQHIYQPESTTGYACSMQSMVCFALFRMKGRSKTSSVMFLCKDKVDLAEFSSASNGILKLVCNQSCGSANSSWEILSNKVANNEKPKVIQNDLVSRVSAMAVTFKLFMFTVWLVISLMFRMLFLCYIELVVKVAPKVVWGRVGGGGEWEHNLGVGITWLKSNGYCPPTQKLAKVHDSLSPRSCTIVHQARNWAQGRKLCLWHKRIDLCKFISFSKHTMFSLTGCHWESSIIL